MTVLIDTREPNPHPWLSYLPDDWSVEIATLETGDVALACLPDGVVIERKTPSDLAGCIGASRERFERELKRSRYCGRFIIVCEGNLSDVCRASRELTEQSIAGTIAAWTTRYCPIVFAGTVASAADFAFRALRAQVRDIERAAKSLCPKAKN